MQTDAFSTKTHLRRRQQRRIQLLGELRRQPRGVGAARPPPTKIGRRRGVGAPGGGARVGAPRRGRYAHIYIYTYLYLYLYLYTYTYTYTYIYKYTSTVTSYGGNVHGRQHAVERNITGVRMVAGIYTV